MTETGRMVPGSLIRMALTIRNYRVSSRPVCGFFVSLKAVNRYIYEKAYFLRVAETGLEGRDSNARRSHRTYFVPMQSAVKREMRFHLLLPWPLKDECV